MFYDTKLCFKAIFKTVIVGQTKDNKHHPMRVQTKKRVLSMNLLMATSAENTKPHYVDYIVRGRLSEYC